MNRIRACMKNSEKCRKVKEGGRKISWINSETT